MLAGVGETDDVLLTPGLNVTLNHVDTRPLTTGIVLLSYHATNGD